MCFVKNVFFSTQTYKWKARQSDNMWNIIEMLTKDKWPAYGQKAYEVRECSRLGFWKTHFLFEIFVGDIKSGLKRLQRFLTNVWIYQFFVKFTLKGIFLSLIVLEFKYGLQRVSWWQCEFSDLIVLTLKLWKTVSNLLQQS